MKNKLLLLSIISLLIITYFISGAEQYLTLQSIKEHQLLLLDYVENNYVQAILLTLFIYILMVSLSLPGATFLSLAVGYIFGRWIGWSILLIAATTGATVVFLLVRYLLSDWAKKKLAQFDRTQKVINEVNRYSINYLLFLRLVPVFPFWLVNLLMAFTKIDTQRYALGTFLGIMPGSFVFANLGQSLASIDSLDNLLSGELLLALALLGLLMLLPVFVKHLRTNQNTSI